MKKAQQYRYNDYELLYMAIEGSSEAMEILIEKYRPLAFTRIKKFRIQPSQVDDFYQESLIVLFKAVKHYDEKSQMSFTNFYDLLLQRRFIDLLRKNKRYYENNVLSENIDIVASYQSISISNDSQTNYWMKTFDDKIISHLSKLELQVFWLKYDQGKKIDEIATELKISPKQVYSASDRIKLKCQKYIKK